MEASPSKSAYVYKSAFDLHLCAWLAVAPSAKSPYFLEERGPRLDEVF